MSPDSMNGLSPEGLYSNGPLDARTNSQFTQKTKQQVNFFNITSVKQPDRAQHKSQHFVSSLPLWNLEIQNIFA